MLNMGLDNWPGLDNWSNPGINIYLFYLCLDSKSCNDDSLMYFCINPVAPTLGGDMKP